MQKHGVLRARDKPALDYAIKLARGTPETGCYPRDHGKRTRCRSSPWCTPRPK